MSEDKNDTYNDKTNNNSGSSPERVEKRDITFNTPTPPPAKTQQDSNTDKGNGKDSNSGKTKD